jgi:hypothetical protein
MIVVAEGAAGTSSTVRGLFPSTLASFPIG